MQVQEEVIFKHNFFNEVRERDVSISEKENSLTYISPPAIFLRLLKAHYIYIFEVGASVFAMLYIISTDDCLDTEMKNRDNWIKVFSVIYI